MHGKEKGKCAIRGQSKANIYNVIFGQLAMISHVNRVTLKIKIKQETIFPGGDDNYSNNTYLALYHIMYRFKPGLKVAIVD